MKKFLTHNQQLKNLRHKNLVIKNSSKTKRILESENYYTIINGYRSIFQDPSSHRPFRFRNGTTFEEIHSLYELDAELRNIYMKYILKIEKSFQSLVAYFFAKDNKNNNRAYLDFRNFRKPVLKKGFPRANAIHKTIAMFSNKMANEHDFAIQHHITVHQEVPIWVLINSLTLGEIAYVYYYLKDHLRLEIAKYYKNHRNKEYSTHVYSIRPDDIDNFLFSAKHFRNACAHNERFFWQI